MLSTEMEDIKKNQMEIVVLKDITTKQNNHFPKSTNSKSRKRSSSCRNDNS